MRWQSLLVLSAAAVSVATCARPTRRSRLGAEPGLRVGLSVNATAVVVEGDGGVEAKRDGRVAFRTNDGADVRVVAEGDRIRVTGRPGAGVYDVLTFRGRGGQRTVGADGRRYRGTVEIRAKDGSLTVVNTVDVESYLRGVVAAELGNRGHDDMEALKAQAVASRTYVLRNRGKFAARGFDVMASVADQVYGGVSAENSAADAAVQRTDGEVMTYAGELIDVFFHSTCGGATAWPTEVFQSVTEPPYLRSVSDRNGDGYYCDISPNFQWTVRWSQAELQEILARTLPSVLGIDPDDVRRVRSLRAYRTGRSGRVVELRVAVDGGEIPVAGPNIRAVLRTPEGRVLASTAVRFSTTTEGGRTTFVGSGGGWGHGVGMCQWGAVGRSRAGQRYRHILAHYFPGTRIERRY